MPVEIIDNRIENIMNNVPTVDQALNFIEENNRIQVDNIFVKYTEKIASAIEDAIKNCKFFAIIKLDSDFHYLNPNAINDLCDLFADLGYKIIISSPMEMDILFN